MAKIKLKECRDRRIGIVFDACVLIDLKRTEEILGGPHPVWTKVPLASRFCTVVSAVEFVRGRPRAARADRHKWLKQNFKMLWLDCGASELFWNLFKHTGGPDRHVRLHIPDWLVAAIALKNSYAVATSNTDDFSSIPRLYLVDEFTEPLQPTP